MELLAVHTEIKDDVFVSAAVEDEVLHLFRKLIERSCKNRGVSQMFGDFSQQQIVVNNKVARPPSPVWNGSVGDGF